jgi:hypothetical protein
MMKGNLNMNDSTDLELETKPDAVTESPEQQSVAEPPIELTLDNREFADREPDSPTTAPETDADSKQDRYTRWVLSRAKQFGYTDAYLAELREKFPHDEADELVDVSPDDWELGIPPQRDLCLTLTNLTVTEGRFVGKYVYNFNDDFATGWELHATIDPSSILKDGEKIVSLARSSVLIPWYRIKDIWTVDPPEGEYIEVNEEPDYPGCFTIYVFLKMHELRRLIRIVKRRNLRELRLRGNFEAPIQRLPNLPFHRTALVRAFTLQEVYGR